MQLVRRKKVNMSDRGWAARNKKLSDAANVADSRAVGGFSVIELLIALTLMALLGGSLLTLISSGSSVFQRVFDEKDAQSEARIALSYVTVKLRQNGKPGVVSLVDSGSPNNRRKVLKIDQTPEVDSDDCYFIYINPADPADSDSGADSGTGGGGVGKLCEKTSNTPDVENDYGTFTIANIRDFDIDYTDETQTQLKITVYYGRDESPREMSTIITLRS